MMTLYEREFDLRHTNEKVHLQNDEHDLAECSALPATANDSVASTQVMIPVKQ